MTTDTNTEVKPIQTAASKLIRAIYPDATYEMVLSLTCGAVHQEQQRQLDSGLADIMHNESATTLRDVLRDCTSLLNDSQHENAEQATQSAS